MSVRVYKDEEEASSGTVFDPESLFFRYRCQVLGQDFAEDALSELEGSFEAPPLIVFRDRQLYRQPLTVRRIGHKLYESDVTYALKNPNAIQWTIKGRTTGGTQKVLGSYATNKSPGAPDFKGAIGYNPKDQSIEGAEVIIPILEFVVEATYPPGGVTNAFINNLATITGSVNNATWLGRQAGEVLYQGADFSGGNIENVPVVIAHSVAVQPNIFAAQIGGLSGINKNGWDFLWFLTEDSTFNVGGNDVPIKKFKHWYVERVYPRANFNLALGFG